MQFKLNIFSVLARTSPILFPLVAMAGRPPEPTLRYLTRQQPDTEKNKKMPNAQRKFFANAFGTFGFAPTHKANASQNQKSQANQSPPTTPNYF